MAGRFTARLAPAANLVFVEAPSPETEDTGSAGLLQATPEPPSPAPSSNPLHSDKLLDAKVRLHRRLIEEINLSALEKLPDEAIHRHVLQLVSQYVLAERLALNTQ